MGFSAKKLPKLLFQALDLFFEIGGLAKLLC